MKAQHAQNTKVSVRTEDWDALSANIMASGKIRTAIHNIVGNGSEAFQRSKPNVSPTARASAANRVAIGKSSHSEPRIRIVAMRMGCVIIRFIIPPRAVSASGI